MARWRSGAREAPRHTGQAYDRGYQFGYPDRALLTFGPWEAIWPMADRSLPGSVLRSVKDGVLLDGVIMPIWDRIEATNVGQIVLGAQELVLGQSQYKMIFYKEALQLKSNFDNGTGSSGSHTYAIDPGSGRISMTSWQQSVYFVSPTLGLVRKYIPTTGVFSAIASSPTNSKFIFVLQNNLVAIRQAGSVYEVVWASDSLPEDWTGVGSGTNPLSRIGEVRGVGVFSDRAIIVGTAGAVVMVPIGSSVSPFAFRDEKAIDGTPFDYGVTFSQDTMFYMGYDKQPRMYKDGVVQEIGQGEGKLLGTPKLFFSERLGYLILTIPEKSQTLFLDPSNRQWVSDLDVAWDFVTDAPLSGKLGYVIGIKNNDPDHDLTTLDLEPATFTLPRITLGKIDFGGDEWTVDYIDIQRTNVDSPKPLAMTLKRITAFDSVQEDKYQAGELLHILEIGQRVRYFVNRPASVIELFFEVDDLPGAIESGPYLGDDVLSSGNMSVNPANTPLGWLGDLRLDGNMDVFEASTEYVSSGALEPGGNMVLVPLSQLEWLINTGIDQIQIALKKQTLQPQRAR